MENDLDRRSPRLFAEMCSQLHPHSPSSSTHSGKSLSRFDFPIGCLVSSPMTSRPMDPLPPRASADARNSMMKMRMMAASACNLAPGLRRFSLFDIVLRLDDLTVEVTKENSLHHSETIATTSWLLRLVGLCGRAVRHPRTVARQPF